MLQKPPVQLQRRLPITVDVSFLSSIDAARRDLRTDEDEVMHLIQDKQLLAFDLRTPGADKAFVRIWTESIDTCRQSRQRGQLVAPLAEAMIDKIIEAVVGQSKEHIRATFLSKRFVTSATHIHNLIAARQLQPVRGTGDTINQSPDVTRASVLQFLKSRRLS